MSCKYCEEYPVKKVPHYSWRYNDGRAEVICKDTYGPVLIVGEFDREACGITDVKGSEIRYCPWCGQDLRGADETEPDEEPDECEEPDEEAQDPSPCRETKLDALRDAIRVALGLEPLDEYKEPLDEYEEPLDEYKEPWDEDEEPDAATTPDYYTADGIEAIDVIEAVCNRAQLAPDDVFCLGNILKYALRAGRKGGTEADFESDCAKAANYAHRMVADGWLDQDGGRS